MKTQYEDLYRSQFVLGSRFLDAFPTWQRLRIGESWRLTAHPNLNICQQTQGEKSITLLGFILDPDSPELTDAQVLSRLLERFQSFPSLFEEASRLGGRWILIVSNGNSTKLFHDACGLRQVFYTRAANTAYGTWCASQPGMIGDLLELQVNREAEEFFRLQISLVDQQCWWPGDSSPFLDVRHLLPNHYLDLETAKPCRYWPQKEINPLSMQEAVDSIGQTLSGLLEGVCNRFDLSLGLTAGLDSRLVLAACRRIAHRMSFHTTQDINEPKDISVDISVANSLLKKLALKHNLIQSSNSINEELFECYCKSFKYPHVCWYPGVQATREFYRLKKVGVAGSGSEIARCFYGVSRQGQKSIAGSELAARAGMGWHPFPRRYFQKWLDDLGNTRGYKILDLFYWEQRVGNWLAMCQAEWDMAWKDIFTPFNCRLLLTQMLGVKEEYRRHPWYDLHKRLISNLWPEVLQEPINPHKGIIENPIRPFQRWIRYKLSAAKHTIKSRIVR